MEINVGDGSVVAVQKVLQGFFAVSGQIPHHGFLVGRGNHPLGLGGVW